MIEDYEYDIYIPEIKLLIEYDGMYWHEKSNRMKREMKKEQFAKEMGYNFLRIKEIKEKKNYIKDGIIYTYYNKGRD